METFDVMRFFSVLKRQFAGVLLLSAGLCGCSEESSAPDMAEVARRVEARTATTLKTTPDELRKQLNCFQAEFRVLGNDIVEGTLYQSGVRNIKPLAGLPLRALDLGMTQVDDLTPLTGMQLQRLDLENTPVVNLAPLQGMPLQILKMQKTNVTDFSVLKGMPLKQLNVLDLPFSDADLELIREAPLDTIWLAGTKVTDLSTFPVTTLKSLDIERTNVASLNFVAGCPQLQRLNIAETPVSDLTPLKGLRLQRMTLTPGRIQSGIEVLRDMKSLTQIQTSMNEPMSAVDFWKRFDLGVWKSTESTVLGTSASAAEMPTTPEPAPANGAETAQ
jgi:internalin A